MKQLLSFTLTLLLMAATACQNGQGNEASSASAQSDSVAQKPHPDLLVVYFYDGDDNQEMGENVLSAFDDLKERFGERIALWSIDSSINTDMYMQLNVQDLPAVLFITHTQAPFYELTPDTCISGTIDRESITQIAVSILAP